MKFFLPAATTDEMRDSAYQQIRAHLAKELGAELSLRRIQWLAYKHNGKNFAAEVGKEESGGEGVVIAILFDQIRSLYLICTPERGVVRGAPILVGSHDVQGVTDFD